MQVPKDPDSDFVIAATNASAKITPASSEGYGGRPRGLSLDQGVNYMPQPSGQVTPQLYMAGPGPQAYTLPPWAQAHMVACPCLRFSCLIVIILGS
eukprot:1353547-Rhodomonas_salina.1